MLITNIPDKCFGDIFTLIMIKYQLTDITATIEVAEYIRNYRDVDKFIVYCHACNRYNSCWACPPFDDVSYQILEEVRRGLDDKLLNLKQQYSNSLVFFAGTCHLCKPDECTRISGKPCLYPDKVRPSLEAFGFDISKTSLQLLHTELKWGSKERLPEYFVLVSGLFTNQEIENIAWQFE